MKRIVTWLETRLSQSKSPSLSDTSAGGKQDEIDLGVDLHNEIRDLVNDVPTPDVGPPKDLTQSSVDAPMPDICVDEHVDTVPNLEILNESAPGTDESNGFNPYDTGILQKD